MSRLLGESRYRRQTFSTDCQIFDILKQEPVKFIFIVFVSFRYVHTYVRCLAFENGHCWKITDNYYC